MAAGPQNYPYQELEFAKDGSSVHPEQADAVRRLADQVTDVVVVSHGWNNDMDEARALYRNLFASMDAVRKARGTGLGDRSIGVVGILWPSKRFADAELIAGGAAGIGDADPALPGDLRAMAGAFDAPAATKILDRAAALVGRLQDSPKAQREYADLLRSLVSADASEPADAPDELFTLDGPDLMDRLQAAMLSLSLGTVPVAGGGATGFGNGIGVGGGNPSTGASGGAAGLGSALTHAWSKGRSLLNFITYYEMKARAGRISSESVASVLHTQVAGRATVHLVGHSFGARLVTAAADGLPGARSIGSLSLLQAAFSHNAFAREWEPGRPGGFRRMVEERRIFGVDDHHPHPQRQGRRHRLRHRLEHRRPGRLRSRRRRQPLRRPGQQRGPAHRGGRQRPGPSGRRRELPVRGRRHPQPPRRPVRLRPRRRQQPPGGERGPPEPPGGTTVLRRWTSVTRGAQPARRGGCGHSVPSVV